MSLFDYQLMYTPMGPKRKTHRNTQIIGTISETMTMEEIADMITAGMNIARFDASKVEGKEGLKTIESSLKVFREGVEVYNEKRRKDCLKQNEDGTGCLNVHVATALDLKGTFIEAGAFQAAANFELGSDVTLTNSIESQDASNDQTIFVNHPKLSSIQPGQTVIIDGVVKLKVIKVDSDPDDVLQCKVVKAGELRASEKLEVNFPGAKLKSTDENEQAMAMVNFCKKNELDMLFAPINDAAAFRLFKCAVEPGSFLKVIAKLEGQAAVQNIDAIIAKADGVMISRSRLGRNVSPELVVAFQKTIFAKCLKAGIPSIVASDVLKSMETEGNDASSAETADIVNSVLDGADCVALEEGVSKPSCIGVLRDIILGAEDFINNRRLFIDLMTQLPVPPSPISTGDVTNVIAVTAVAAAMINDASAIIVLTEAGNSVRLISKYRPECPIIAVTRCPFVARSCMVYHGVMSIDIGGELKFIYNLWQGFHL